MCWGLPFSPETQRKHAAREMAGCSRGSEVGTWEELGPGLRFRSQDGTVSRGSTYSRPGGGGGRKVCRVRGLS